MNTAFEQRDLWADEAPAAEGPHHIRVSARAQRLSVRVMRSGRVEVVVPRRTPPRLIERFLSEHREWIDTRRALALRHAPPKAPFPPGDVHFGLSGERWRLDVAGGSARARLYTAPGLLRITGAATADASRLLLRRWLLAAARNTLTPFLANVAREIGVPYRSMQVRRQRTRWGSCSAKGALSLNVCLVFQPPPVVRYLCIHELTHLSHMNHSARFWSAVARHEPHWRRLDRQLLDGWQHVPAWVFGEE